MNEYIINYKGIKRTYYNKTAYLNFKDFIENGLKVVERKDKTYFFNNNAILINTSYINKTSYILLIDNKKYNNSKYLKKYVELI